MVKSYLKKFMPKIVSIALLSAIGTFSAYSQIKVKPSIVDLTSKETSKSVSGRIPKPKRAPEEIKKHSFGVGIGQTFLNSELGQNGDDHITIDLYYNYSASHSFDLLVNLHHSSHDRLPRKASITGLAVGIKGRLFQFDSFSPFVVGGLGFYAPTVTRYEKGSFTETPMNIAFGSHFGAGGELKLNDKFKIATLLHFHNPFDSRQEMGKVLEGSYYKLLINSYYTF